MPSFISQLRKENPVRIAILLILAVTCFRLWYATHIGLVADEAYYWLWAKHLAASYRDKGPAVAWIIALGTKMFGDTVFGIRFFAVILSSGAGWLIFTIARRLYDERIALNCLLMTLIMPLFAIGSILMTIDTPSVFFWALAVLLFWNALHNDKISTWVWLGLAIGAGFLAKFTNGVQLICIALFLLWSKEHRPLLFSRKIFIMLAAFFIASLPIVWWNVQTGWVHVMALHSRSGVTDSFHIRPGQLIRFIGEQFGVVSPLFMAGMAVAAIALLARRDGDLRTRFLLSQFLPVYGIFLFFSLNSAGKPNWTVPAFVTGIIFTVVFWRELAARQPRWRWGVNAAIGMALIMTVGLHDIEILHLPRRLDPMHRMEGWEDFAAHVQKDRIENKANVLLGSDYSMASLLSFYLPDQPMTYMPPGPYGSTQFTLWPSYKVTPNTRALFVTWKVQKAPDMLQKQFSKIELVDQFWSQYHNRPMKFVCVYLCTPN